MPTSESTKTQVRAPATRRILSAARSLVARGGADAVSMGDVALSAGVSKALVHYHFDAKDPLLRALVDDVGAATLDRERRAMSEAGAAHALDSYWDWLDGELRRGDIQILVALAEYGSDMVRDASRRLARERRDLAATHVASVFARLGLTPRIPADLLAGTVVAFIDGLAVNHALDPEQNPRPAFDVLWLALLTLVE